MFCPSFSLEVNIFFTTTIFGLIMKFMMMKVLFRTISTDLVFPLNFLYLQHTNRSIFTSLLFHIWYPFFTKLKPYVREQFDKSFKIFGNDEELLPSFCGYFSGFKYTLKKSIFLLFVCVPLNRRIVKCLEYCIYYHWLY